MFPVLKMRKTQREYQKHSNHSKYIRRRWKYFECEFIITIFKNFSKLTLFFSVNLNRSLNSQVISLSLVRSIRFYLNVPKTRSLSRSLSFNKHYATSNIKRILLYYEDTMNLFCILMYCKLFSRDNETGSVFTNGLNNHLCFRLKVRRNRLAKHY